MNTTTAVSAPPIATANIHTESFHRTYEDKLPGKSATIYLQALDHSDALRDSDRGIVCDAVRVVIRDCFRPTMERNPEYAAGERRFYLHFHGVPQNGIVNGLLAFAANQAMEREAFPIPIEIYVDQLATCTVHLDFCHGSEARSLQPLTTQCQGVPDRIEMRPEDERYKIRAEAGLILISNELKLNLGAHFSASQLTIAARGYAQAEDVVVGYVAPMRRKGWLANVLRTEGVYRLTEAGKLAVLRLRDAQG